jgi:hypothetical protein
MARCVPSGPRYYDVDVMPSSEARWTILTYTQGPFIALTVVGQGGYAVRSGRVGGDRYQDFRTAPHIHASAVHLLGIKLPDASDDATPAMRTLDMLLIRVDSSPIVTGPWWTMNCWWRPCETDSRLPTS